MKKLLLSAICLAVLSGAVPAPGNLRADKSTDWPQWRGPDRNDVSAATGLLQRWPAGGPKLLWTFSEAGSGYSGPAVVGDRLYTIGAEDDKEWLFALDTRSQKKLWSCEVGTLWKNAWGNGPRGTPAVDGAYVFALGGQGSLICAETATGKLVWRKNLPKDLDGKMMSGWGYSESPLVDGDKVLCTPGGQKGTVAALDKKTGEVLWRSKNFTDTAAYSSLVVSEAGGVRQYVQMTGESVAGIDAKDGRLLWRYKRPSRVAAIPTPLIYKDYVYVTSGYGTGCALLKLTRQGNDFTANMVYDNKNMTNHHGGVVLVKGYIYGYSDGKGWVCQDFKTGKIVWQERQKLGKGSLTYANGDLYCYSENNGTAVLVPASPKGWSEKGRFTLPRKEAREKYRHYNSASNIWTHPVVANGQLFLRDQDLLFCYNVKK